MRHILLAEDNPDDVFLVQHALQEHQIEHELHTMSDGEKALEFVGQVGQAGSVPRLDLVLLDLNLPKADGQQVLVELRNNPECAATPVIIISSSDANKDRNRMTGLNVSRYFRKPSDLEDFLSLGAVVREVLEEEPSAGPQE